MEVDFDEIGAETLVQIDGLSGFFRGFDADGTGPCRRVVIDLAAGGEDARAFAFPGANLVAPTNHMVREVATHFGDAHDAIGKEEIEHGFVFGGQAGSGVNGIRTKVNVHVPEAGQQVLALCADDPGVRRKCHTGSGAGHGDSPVGNQDRLIVPYCASNYVDNIDVLYRGRIWGCRLRLNPGNGTAKSANKEQKTR